MDKQTQQAMGLFLVIVLASVALASAAAYAIGDKAGQMGGLVLLPVAVVPMLAAWMGHKKLGATDRMFGGLVWGGAWIFYAWCLGILAGFAALVLAVGLGAMAIDPSMEAMMEVAMAQASTGGQELPESAIGITRMMMQITAIAGPTIGVVFTAAIGCLGTLPWLGWFGRRLLSLGRAQAAGILCALWGLIGVSGAFAPVPGGMDLGMSLGMRMLVGAIGAACMAPAMWWLFLRTRSAVVPAMFQAALQGMTSLGMYYGADMNFMLAPPSGLLVAAASLFAGLGLWVLKDPGGESLAIRGSQG